MIGNWRWNLWFGLFGLLLTFLFSFSDNPFMTSLFRSFYVFVLFFIAAFVVRFALGTLVGLKSIGTKLEEEQQQVGNQVDMMTPDESGEIQEMLKQQMQDTKAGSDFSPLSPPKLARTNSNQQLDPTDLAQAIRHLTEE